MTIEAADPVSSVDAGDPGDETQRRFRYQANYIALKALQLFSSESRIAALYCEQIEDLIIERSDKQFIGIQIKTRELDQKPWKSSDDAIFRALVHFCIRDARHRGHFAYFVLATNFVFFSGEGVECLPIVLKCAKENPALDGIGPRHNIRKYLTKIAEAASASLDDVIATLAKVALEERKTGIDQPDLELVHALGENPAYSGLRIDQLMHGAECLRSRVLAASSLAMGGSIIGSHAVTNDFDAHLNRLRLANKRLDDKDLTEALEKMKSAPTEDQLLTIHNYLVRDSIPPGLGRMTYKMGDGGISYLDVDQMKDEVATLEGAFLHWKERLGLAEANKRLAHFQHLALRDARIAKVETQRDDARYGQDMLGRFRQLASETIKNEANTSFGCRKEHLHGAAGLLTEECKIWWGKEITSDGPHGDIA